MNLWAKRIGQLMMAVALFFFSCEEETTLLGFKADQRFNVYYTEIPVLSSVYLHDSVVTSNFYTESLNRLLVGEYQDNSLGSVSASAYAQFSRLSALPDSLTFGIYDSISLQLSIDAAYFYGSDGATQQQMEVYELDDTLARFSLLHPYYSSSTIPVKPTSIGTKTFTIDPALFKDYVEQKIDTTIRFKLDEEFGMRVFQEVVSIPSDSSSTYFYDQFRYAIKGIALKPGQSDKIASFNPFSTKSKIVIHFHINKRDSVVLGFSSFTSFNHLEGDRSATELAAITDHYNDVEVSQGYVQNGVSLLTRLDFAKFLEMADTIPAMIINSAELVIGDVEVPLTNQAPPTKFILRIIDDENLFKVDSTDQDVIDIAKYSFTVGSRSSGTGSYVILDDSRRATLTLPYSSTDNKYNGFLTLFLQELYKNRRNDGPLFSTVALYPSSPAIGKTINRTVFNKNSIKLRVYYTRPTLNSNQ
ncbi:MAG TPA: DUF4270 family protein [Cyclobacteriaceae bacterium]|nr:DUF4270 family protein [Cyclobacteriaceae bacterium]